MGPALDGGYDELAGRDMIAMVSDIADLEALATIGRRRGRPVAVHLKIDTGMTRLGIQLHELAAVIERAGRGGVIITGLATHMACADDDDPLDPQCMTYAQLARFEEAVALARAAGVRPRMLHAANSSATLLFSRARLDAVRVGLALYGNGHAPANAAWAPVMRLVSRIVQVREAPAGATVSYGARWRAPRPSRLAVVPIGYADGYPRRLTGSAEVLIAGRRCPVVGAITMDITIVDVTALGDAAQVGQEVVLLGTQADEHISAAELAERAQLTQYEVTCGISKRAPRVYG